MHFHFPFTAVQALWTLTFAAQLVLLTVLLGRERARRYPWFTASIAVNALSLLSEELLTGRMAKIPLQAIAGALAEIEAIVGLLVVLELTRLAFAGTSRRTWIVWTLALAALVGGALVALGPWPATWKDLAWDSVLGRLRLMQFLAQKTDLIASLFAVELGLLAALFGSGFKAGWKSHTQRIAIGLGSFAAASLGAQLAVQHIARTAQFHSRAEYERLVGRVNNLFSASEAVYVAVLVWWIACLWIDEPGAAPAYEAAPDSAEAPLPDAEQTSE